MVAVGPPPCPPEHETLALRGRLLLAVGDLSPREIRGILSLAQFFKQRPVGEHAHLLRGKTLAMLFEKPSLRTRVSFEVAMTQLGGNVVFATGSEFSVGSRETPEDAAGVLSRYADAIVVRTHEHEPLMRFARAASVPVINGLSAAEHPCQALADMLTLKERFGSLQGLRIAYLGDARNNVATSLALVAACCGAQMTFGCPPTHRPASLSVRAFASAVRAVRDADAVYTDVWTSMGEEALTERNRAVLGPYAVTSALMKHAAPHAVFMHCLPAHRGQEVEAAVIDGPQSIVFDQAENRMHMQKAILAALLADLKGYEL